MDNWQTDANAFKADYLRADCEDCEVHSGFLNLYDDIKD